MLAALALALLAQCGPDGPIYSCPSAMGGYALFEFAPASGAGMGAACACTTPSGLINGVATALTFARASTGFCTKGNETTSIANGDLVECAANQPRVMPGGDGSGGLGISVWEARTNACIRNTAFDDVAWTLSSSGVALPTITANFAIAPDGTMTAERMQIPATSGVQYSLVGQLTRFTVSVAGSGAVYVRGNGTSGQTCVAIGGDGALCNYVSSSWTDCKVENKTPSSGTPLWIGNYSGATTGCNGVSFGASDILIWGAECETGGCSTVGPVIATAGTAATRAVETATFDLGPSTGVSAGSMSMAATTAAATWTNTYATALSLNSISTTDGTGTNVDSLYSGGTAGSLKCASGNSIATVFSTGFVTPVASGRHWCSTQASGVTGASGASNMAASGALSGTFGNVRYLNVGNLAGSPTLGAINGVVKKVCIDSDPARCR